MAEVVDLRLFIAVDLPERVKDALGKAIAELRADIRGPYRWVAPEAIHLTVKFLGSVSPERVPSIGEALVQAALGHSSFSLHLDGTGTFPPNGPPSVVWAGLGGDVEALVSLQRAVEGSLDQLGFAPEQRTFSPHLTLARVRDRLSRSDAEQLRDRLSGLRWADQEEFAVEGVSLIRSELRREGARYTTLARVSF